MKEVTVARIYVSEAKHNLERIVHFLHDEAQVCGVTIFRGIAGYGVSGKIHDSHLVDLSFDLPLVIEFFDEREKVTAALTSLEQFVAPKHVLTWSAFTN